MKRLLSVLVCSFMVAMITTSCENELKSNDSIVKGKDEVSNIENQNAIFFSQILSKAVNENVDLRVYIKTEAMKMMDRDYDVFYHLIKNNVVIRGKTFREILLEYANSESEYKALEESMPLLTIYVPELPSGFNAETWDAVEEVPFVTSGTILEKYVSFYKNGVEEFSLKSDCIPGFPVLIVKNNERIKRDNGLTKTSSSLGNGYEFIDQAFDGSDDDIKKTKSAIIDVSRENYSHLMTAYTEMGVSGYTWQRDNIYYGLDQGDKTSGTLNRSIIESIRSIRLTTQAFSRITDQTGDPEWVGSYYGPGRDKGKAFWTEGQYEFKIDVLVSNMSGLGSTLTKYVPIDPSRLFEHTYKKTLVSGDIYCFQSTGIKALEGGYPVRINLITWDLEKNGFSWKFLISEIDDEQTSTREETIKTEFGANFSMGFKFGLNFGASGTVSKTSRFSIVTNLNSDDLGTLEANFSDPVYVKQVSLSRCEMYTISNSYIELMIVPIKNY